MTLIQFARPKNRKLKLIVTGTGRSGTGFAAKWLISIGIPSGHELFFTHRGLHMAQQLLRNRHLNVIGECSWEAAPYLNTATLRDVLVVHQVRHPKRVFESCMRVPIHITPHYAGFLERHLPQVRMYSGELNRTACRYIYWNRMIEKAIQERESFFWRVEDGQDGLLHWLDEHGMVNAKKIHPAQLFGNTRYNHKHGPPVEARLENIHQTLRQPLEDMMARYGYDRWK